MKTTDKITSCALVNSRFAGARQFANIVFNVCGIMFFVTFLGYIALHCF